eukprot:TRINITY_DN4805_c0_g1_i2.p1 TRINITY_DN4805_c0_g1~~TRINITY_DN4805_c0_g1_i2.p1  ORF type:complete len:313 (-),score=47.14 TRINITY_DN4805_c0_g1_i2:132-1070(-)
MSTVRSHLFKSLNNQQNRRQIITKSFGKMENQINRNEIKKINFYSAWFCPYAQRAWVTLNYFNAPNVEIIESLQVDPKTKEYVKNKRLLEINPKGLVPTLEIFYQKENNPEEKMLVLTDSIKVASWLFQNFAEKGDEQNLQISPELISEAEEFNIKICSVFYQILMRQSLNEQQQAWDQFVAGLKYFVENGLKFQNLESKSHQQELTNLDQISFYKNPDKLTVVDITIFPYIHRFKEGIIKELKPGVQKIDKSQEWVQKLDAWYKRMVNLEAVSGTFTTREKILGSYARYADGTAKSLVGDAVRAGGHAHEV